MPKKEIFCNFHVTNLHIFWVPWNCRTKKRKEDIIKLNNKHVSRLFSFFIIFNRSLYHYSKLWSYFQFQVLCFTYLWLALFFPLNSTIIQRGIIIKHTMFYDISCLNQVFYHFRLQHIFCDKCCRAEGGDEDASCYCVHVVY